MNKTEQFFECIKNDMTMTLATSDGERVTMRVVSPVYYSEEILFFTQKGTNKYEQLLKNPNCCIAVGTFFCEAKAVFLGSTMNGENETLREAYSAKFPGAFDEGIEFGGRNSEFIMLKPVKLSGWAYENDIPNEEGVPNIPFEIMF